MRDEARADNQREVEELHQDLNASGEGRWWRMTARVEHRSDTQH